MVLINGVKYACERCVRGHRVTTCNHTDQPLMMIKPKGRPSTTCIHCRELRKNKNANPTGKCSCGRQEKKRLAQVMKDEAKVKAKEKESCRCIDKEACVCHKTRQTRKKRVSGHESSSDTTPSPNVDVETKTGLQDCLPSYNSFQSLDKNFKQTVNPNIPTYLSNNVWNTNVSSYPMQADSRSITSNTPIGLDPLNDVKPITAVTRTRVAEVSIPVDDYVSNDLSDYNNIGYSNSSPLLEIDTITFINDGKGSNNKLDFFADTSKSLLNYNALKEQQRKTNIPELPLLNNQFFLNSNLNVDAQNSSHSSTNNSYSDNIVRSERTIQNFGSVHDGNSFLMQSLNSSDSISSLLHGNNYNVHQYQDMLHHFNQRSFEKGNQQSVNTNEYTNKYSLDNESVRSLDLSSLAPSFIDVPDSNKPDQLNFPVTLPQNENKHNEELRQRSSSIHRNHRYSNIHLVLHNTVTDLVIDPQSNNVDINHIPSTTFDDNTSLKSLTSPLLGMNTLKFQQNDVSPPFDNMIFESILGSDLDQHSNQTCFGLDTHTVFSDNSTSLNTDISPSFYDSTTTNDISNPQQKQVNESDFSGLDSLTTNL